MIVTDRRALRDHELVELLAGEPELLALSDAYASTQHPHWQTRQPSTLLRLGLLAAVVAAILVPAAAFADQIGAILGLSNTGTPVSTDRFPTYQLSALNDIGFPTGQVRLLAQRAGVNFYAAKNGVGHYCFAIGFGSEATPRLDALGCRDGELGTFPSSTAPVADFSQIAASADGTTTVTTLAGFATDAVDRVAVLGDGGETLSTVPVTNNVYAADNLPETPAAAIVAYNHSDVIVYTRHLAPPPAPQPATP
jgi:hypothetical protein